MCHFYNLKVLILIILEVGFEFYKVEKNDSGFASLNPYYSGSRNRMRSERAYNANFETVLILIILEVGIESVETLTDIERSEVLILIILEVGIESSQIFTFELYDRS